jgi:hypothetical protein
VIKESTTELVGQRNGGKSAAQGRNSSTPMGSHGDEEDDDDDDGVELIMPSRYEVEIQRTGDLQVCFVVGGKGVFFFVFGSKNYLSGFSVSL